MSPIEANDGQTIKIEARWGQGKPETMPSFGARAGRA
jgi:hypothetical protein